MISLKVVKGLINEELALAAIQPEEGMLHGAKGCENLVQPWAFSDKAVCSDSYLASVLTANELMSIGLCFIEVAKTATSMYLMAWLSNVERQIKMTGKN